MQIKEPYKSVCIYIFSYNRGRFLHNCITSIKECIPFSNAVIVDDNSSDADTLKILESARDSFEVVQSRLINKSEYKTGGLYSNMNYALLDAYNKNYTYALFIQDDMQFVRNVTQSDIYSAQQFFSMNRASFQLYTCFLKKKNKNYDDHHLILDKSKLAYFRVNEKSGYAYFNAVGLFYVPRTLEILEKFDIGENINNKTARNKDALLGISVRPFMMWLPFPTCHRGKRKSISLKCIEYIGGAGYYPYKYMTDNEVKNLLSRDPIIKPYAENYLNNPSVSYIRLWSTAGGMSNVKVRGGWRLVIGRLLKFLIRNIRKLVHRRSMRTWVLL